MFIRELVKWLNYSLLTACPEPACSELVEGLSCLPLTVDHLPFTNFQLPNCLIN